MKARLKTEHDPTHIQIVSRQDAFGVLNRHQLNICLVMCQSVRHSLLGFFKAVVIVLYFNFHQARSSVDDDWWSIMADI